MKRNSVINKNREECCGCASCSDICPRNAISMQPDPEGFLYPIVNVNICIDCGLCKKKCPTESHNLKNTCQVKKTYCGRYTASQRVQLVSSGGLCDAAASHIIGLGGVVYGTGYSDDFHSVIIKRVERIEDLYQIRGSKYVQSIKPDGIYKNICDDIKKGLQVLFIGVPCDVAAVKNHIGEFANLTTIEIICSGVPSPEIHRQFAKHIESTTGKNITSFSYRKKQHGWHWPYVEIKSKNDVIYNRSWSTMELGYAFMTLVRSSCYNCKFKNVHNLSDITAGDFWGLKKSDPRYYSNGVSAIIARTNKGKELIEHLPNFDLRHASISEIKLGNPRLYSCPNPRHNREMFSELFIKKGLMKAYKESLTLKDYLRNLIMTIYSILNVR